MGAFRRHSGVVLASAALCAVLGFAAVARADEAPAATVVDARPADPPLTGEQAKAWCIEQIAAGVTNPQVEAHLAELLATATAAEEVFELQRLAALAALCGGRFAEAHDRLAALLQTTEAAGRPEIEALLALLGDYPDGQYVVTAEHLAAGALLGEAEPVPPGTASLADPTVLRFALRDLAAGAVDKGLALMARAGETKPDLPDRAETLYALAAQRFGWADGLVEGLGAGYRREAVAARISLIHDRIEQAARQFDTELKAIGRIDLPVDIYRGHLQSMQICLLGVDRDLQTILGLAAVDPDHFDPQIRCAHEDLQRIGRMRTTLEQELHEAQ
ncbi:MAG: hypothetical protein GX591_01180 [Planctomycetes bacterium]|nr:hypothetical protein [Planctomycetota bacterium]